MGNEGYGRLAVNDVGIIIKGVVSIYHIRDRVQEE